ncbi:MAG: hypothetical protein LC648_04800 [Novosphingobium sp.]|nr:hypothetical protein [Novosphingobium sp.]
MVSEDSARVAPTAPPKLVTPAVLIASARAVSSESTVLPNPIAPPIVLVSVVSALSVTASL